MIGGGFTGLSAALHMAQHGARVVILEALDIGWGASGRNNGQVIPGLKLDPVEVEGLLGAERAGRMVAWAGAAPSVVFDLIRRYDLRCSPVRTGWIQPAYSLKGLRAIEARCGQWARRGADVQLLNAQDTAALLGTTTYLGAWIDRRGGSIQPMSYARELARVAATAGATIHTRSQVRDLARSSTIGWSLRTSDGELRANSVVVATAAYCDDLVAGLRRTFVPVRTAQVATGPLPARQLATILPCRQVASDTRRLLTSFRISPDQRLVMGGSGATAGDHKVSLEKHLHRSARELFGHLGALRWEFCWSGYFAVTADYLPHVHEPQADLHVALGCNGRGIAISTAMGKLLAERILGRDSQSLEVPVTRLRPFPFHSMRKLGVASLSIAKRFHDATERWIDKRRAHH